MPEPKRPLKVFLCHSSADKPEVRNWYKQLVADGVDAWLDVESLLPGQKWKIEIPKAIRNSDIVLVFLSKDSINKEGFVQKEIKEALDIADKKLEDTIFIIPARLEDCQVPNRLADYQWVDLYNSEGYNKLIRALEVRARTTNATLLPAKISKIDEVKSKAIEFEKIGDYSQSLEEYSELKKLEPSYSGIDEKIQEVELKVLESQAIKHELMGDLWNALKTWYEIKRIDPQFPRVDIKIEELEREISVKDIREKAERQAALRDAIRKFLPKLMPFLRIIGGVGIIIIFFWAGSWVIPQVASLMPTAKPSAMITYAVTSISPTKTITPTATKTKTPTPTVTPTPTLPIEITTDKGVEMRLVPAGEFIMGSDSENDESPPHTVSLKVFYIDKYEVSNAFYKICVDQAVCLPPKKGTYFLNKDYQNFPVVYVNWDMAKIYCEWRGARLPTEAEWEKSARGENARIYPWGNQFDGSAMNFCDKNCIGDPDYSSDDGFAMLAPVDSFPEGISKYGLFNMAGNVAEWVSSLYKPYPYDATDGREDLTIPGERLLRGGAWNSNYLFVRTTSRMPREVKLDIEKDNQTYGTGFRCARDANP